MNPLMIAQLAVILAPLAQSLVVEGGKIVATIKDNLTQADLEKALETSKSAGWPELTFGVIGA